mgnify:CR=1 FL=1
MKIDSKQQGPATGTKAKPFRTPVVLTVVVGIWMFVLGLLIGRGTVGPQFDARLIEKEVDALKQEFIKKQEKLSELIKNQSEAPQDSNLVKALETTGNNPKSLEPLSPEILEKRRQEQLAFEEQLREAGTVTDDADADKQPEATAAAQVSKPAPPTPLPHPAAQTTPPQLPKPETANVTIQVASVQDPQEAIKLVTDLKRKGFAAYTTPVYLAGKGVWYRVRVGKFAGSPEAQEVLKQMGAKGHSGVVVKQ